MGLFGKKNKKYSLAMNKTRKGIFGNIKNALFSSKKIDEDLFEELEELFIMADIGVDTTLHFIDMLKKAVKKSKISNPKDLQPVIEKELKVLYQEGGNSSPKLNVSKEKLSIYLVVGVNGVGKTTSIAKMAYRLANEGKRVLVAAGDTFRAGAVEQIKVWGDRVGFEVVSKSAGSDPSSVIFDGVKRAKEEDYDVLICDTAGRLQNKTNLMNELSKIKRVISREIPDAPHETLLVLDATTGQNGMSQAKSFTECTSVTGIILTKLDGTAKGGIVLAIRNKMGIPIKFVGLGEKVDDLEVFDIEEYLDSLFEDMF